MTTAARILVVDDEPDLLTLYELALIREGHQVQTASTLAEARSALAETTFDVLITDMRLPDGLGMELLRELAAARRPERSIMVTAYGSPETAVEALKAGAFDYLTKPVDLKQLRTVVASALQDAPAPARAAAPAASAAPAAPQAAAARPAPATLPPAAPAAPAAPAFEGEDISPQGQAALARLVGQSPAMQMAKQRIAKVARSMAPVLVHGESGTGKELVANAVHACSHRASGPFVPVNCGAIPENLLEAEFFGARKGSYTGATQDRAGFFQAAAGGTLFLDEIGDLPLAMQAKLLRAIQERRVRPLGATQEEPVDVRIVSATHKDLAAQVQAGHFRQDLYYRLNVIELIVPPLRERREDLPLLCQALLARIASEAGSPPLALTPQLMRDIASQPLEGNVRELENLLHRAVALGEVALAGSPGALDWADAARIAAAATPAWPPPAAAMPAPALAAAYPAAPPHAQPPQAFQTPQTLPQMPPQTPSLQAPLPQAPFYGQPAAPAQPPQPYPPPSAVAAQPFVPPPAPAAFQPPAPTFAEQTARAAQAYGAPFSLEPAPAAPPAAPVSDAGLPPGEAVASGQTPLPSDLEAWLNEQERQVLIRALNETGFNRTAAAARLGLNLRQIRYRMARLGIVPPGSHAEESGNDGDDGEAA